MKRIVCIRLVDWAVARIRVERPELNRKPIVLWETHRGSRRVAACSAEAGALGVRVGMPSAEAMALAGSPAFCLEAYDPSGDREALEKLAVWCGRFSPLVGLDDAAAPDCLLLDVTGLGHLFGGEASLAERIVHDFAQRGLAVRVAVADTIGAAWAVAHFGQRGKRESGRGDKGLQIEDCKLKIEDCKLQIEDCELQISDWCDRAIPQFSIYNFQFTIFNLQSPPSVFVIPPGGASAALRPLPVEALRLSDDVVDLLRQLGIDKIGQLEWLPRADFRSRFGPRLLERWDQAMGRLAEPIPAQPLPPELRATRWLEHPTTRRETIEFLLEQLIGEVARMLVRCGRGAVRLDCRLECQAAQGVELSVGLFQPTALPRHLFELMRMQLERVWLPGPVSAVSVEAAVTAPFERQQEELFADGRSPRRWRQLAGLVDRLASRLGRSAVLRARLVRDAQPELAYRYEPLVGASPAKRSRRSTLREGPRAELPPRPLRLLAQPVALVAVSIMPDGPPLRFQFQGCEHRVVHTWGPERIETGWWRGRPVRRDYYHVETTTGRRYWLFRHLDDGGWFLHGTFE